MAFSSSCSSYEQVCFVDRPQNFPQPSVHVHLLILSVFSVSKQPFLQEVPNPHELPDGTSSYKDFVGNRNNRFTNPEAAQKNRIQSPSKVLHFFNAPPGITEEELNEVSSLLCE